MKTSRKKLSVKIRKSNSFYYFLAAFAFLNWGTSFAFGKLVTPEPLNPITITAARTLIGLITIFIIITIKGKIKSWLKSFKKSFWKYLLIGVVFYFLGYFMEYWSLARTESSNQAILSNTMVLWVIFINYIFFKQKPDRSFLLGLILAIAGVLLILLGDELNFTSETEAGDIGTLVAYLLWGSYSAFMAKINQSNEPLHSTLSIFVCGSILLIPVTIIQGGFSEIVELSTIQWGAVSYLGIMCSGIAFWVYHLALSNPHVKSEYIAIFSLLNPIIGVFAGMVVHEEIIVVREIIGTLLILFSIIFVNLIKDKHKSENSKLQVRKIQKTQIKQLE